MPLTTNWSMAGWAGVVSWSRSSTRRGQHPVNYNNLPAFILCREVGAGRMLPISYQLWGKIP